MNRYMILRANSNLQPLPQAEKMMAFLVDSICGFDVIHAKLLDFVLRRIWKRENKMQLAKLDRENVMSPSLICPALRAKNAVEIILNTNFQVYFVYG